MGKTAGRAKSRRLMNSNHDAFSSVCILTVKLLSSTQCCFAMDKYFSVRRYRLLCDLPAVGTSVAFILPISFLPSFSNIMMEQKKSNKQKMLNDTPDMFYVLPHPKCPTDLNCDLPLYCIYMYWFSIEPNSLS